LSQAFDIFLVASPGHEAALLDEVKSLKFTKPVVTTGGVTIRGTWKDVWRANLEVRGSARVLARIGSFRAPHLAQLDRRARNFPWGQFLHNDIPLSVETTCTRSRIYHAGAANERIMTAIREELEAPIEAGADLCIKARIDDDLCTISVDTSGESLHKRGHKEAIGKAPIRETLAAMFLRQCGYDGKEPVLDPMCGSGTFVIEAAEIAAGLHPGRDRNFAFERLKTFDPEKWNAMRAAAPKPHPDFRFYGSDRDAGAIKMSKANAERAGVSAITEFVQRPISDIEPPEGSKGLVIVNPPYGTRIGDKKPLFALYGAMGKTLREKFSGWRVGVITTEVPLAMATTLPFKPHGKPVSHGGLKVFLFQSAALP
jgi:putative N6-adenine-specific DNA methylase